MRILVKNVKYTKKIISKLFVKIIFFLLSVINITENIVIIKIFNNKKKRNFDSIDLFHEIFFF